MRGFDLIRDLWRRRMAGMWPSLSRTLLTIGGASAAVLVGGLALGWVMLSLAEPSLQIDGDLYALNRPPALTFLDERGRAVGRRGAFVGERLKLSEMPPYLPQAFLVMEDRRFYQHDGIDARGLLRAALVDLKAMRFVQGGSTITQQLVKTLFLTPDRTLSRKFVEMAGARKLERMLSKDQILELYLNRIYLGAGAYGVDGAARIYFGKSARDVTLAEATMLAALTNAPSVFSPRRDLKVAQQRSGLVLDTLVAQGAMSASLAAEARSHPATIVADTTDQGRDYFLDTAAEEAKSLMPTAQGDLVITTTLDPAMQQAARASIVNALKRSGKSARVGQAALVAMTPDGAIRALMGGMDYAESTFNRATKAHRAPGSAFKPMVYLTALEKGLARDTVRNDGPVTIADWSPDNITAGYAGPVTLQDALVRSINTVAVELGQEVGLPSVIEAAHRLGIKSELQPNASLPIGTSEVTPLELTAAYASFASLGYAAEPYTVREIHSASGDILYRREQYVPRQVMATEDALAMNAMLYEVVQSGTGRGALLSSREVAGKTGTSSEYRDAWFVGFSPELVTGVWVGNDDYTPTKRVTGGALPAQIWKGFMQAALKNVPPTALPRAEPLDPYVSVDGGGYGYGFFDRLGNFFDRLFGGREMLPPPPPPPRQRRGWMRNSENSWEYVPESESPPQIASNEREPERMPDVGGKRDEPWEYVPESKSPPQIAKNEREPQRASERWAYVNGKWMYIEPPGAGYLHLPESESLSAARPPNDRDYVSMDDLTGANPHN